MYGFLGIFVQHTIDNQKHKTMLNEGEIEKPAVQRDDINAHLQVLSLTIGPESVNGFSKVDDECLEAVGCYVIAIFPLISLLPGDYITKAHERPGNID